MNVVMSVISFIETTNDIPLGFETNPEKSSYYSTAENLKNFLEINELPSALQKIVGQYEFSTDLAMAFVDNKAVFHKSCLSMYDKQKLSRKRKLVVESEDNDKPSRSTRRNTTTHNFSGNCFFCDKEDEEIELHLCQTLYLDMRVRKIAHELNDTKLLAKLSEGDMVATEAKYHRVCLVQLYNRYRTHNLNKSRESEFQLIAGIALSEVINFVEECILSSDQETVPVFQLQQLKDMYQKRLIVHGASVDIAERVHVTRLKNVILENVPGMCATKSGKYVLLTLDGEMGRALFDACLNSNRDDGLLLAKVAHMIRKDIFSQDEVFDGDLSKDRQLASVPSSLLQLVALIMEGGSDQEKMSDTSMHVAGNIAQLIRFNATKRKRNEDVRHIRHSKDNEPPLPVYIGLLLHSKTRKKCLINDFAVEGLSISYNRVEEIQTNITNQLCSKYAREGRVCPTSLLKGIFTSAAIDNIDSNPSSTTAMSSFHGTSISIFQHPAHDIEEEPFKLEKVPMHSTKLELPVEYTNIQPSRGGKPEPPPTKPLNSFPVDKSIYDEADNWISKMNHPIGNLQERISFSGFYSKHIATSSGKSIIELLPLLQDSVNSPAMVRHCMLVIKDLKFALNPEQDPVITGDQPVYALGKQVQWMYPQDFDRIVWMMGPLHIEMAFINVNGDWLHGSGWCEVLNKANISTPGRVESFLKGSHVKRSRYAHQLCLSALTALANDVFQTSDKESYEEWVRDLKESSINARYWFTVIELETLLFMFVRSLREANFHLFVCCLKEMLPWMFALDHVHYSRWMSVFIHDLEMLPVKHSNVFNNFMKGHFTVSKSDRMFSGMAEDQAHEQNNKLVKIDGGAIGILSNENALLKWATSGPQIAKLIQTARSKPFDDGNEDSRFHHEDTDSFEKKFRLEREKLIEVFKELGNPFEELEDGLVNIATKHVLNEVASESVRVAKDKGQQQSKEFKENCLVSGTKSLYCNIPKNRLALFRQKNAISTSKQKQQLVSLKSDCRLYASLYVACQVRKGNLDDFFLHENHSYPISISEYGKLRKCNEKSAFLKCLEDIKQPQFDSPVVDGCVIDGAAFVHMNPPVVSQTYGQYCDEELRKKLISISKRISRLDLVFDVYTKTSMKSQTRESRGAGVRVSVRSETPIYKKFKEFMRNDDNKTELFNMIADSVASFESENLIISTKNSRVTSNHITDTTNLEPCNHEEADTRLLIHVNDASQKGIKKIKIITVDTDVVVIALCVFHSLNLSELWIEFGTGQHRRWLPIHDYATLLGEEICRALPFWYAITGCDTVSMFAGRGKKTCWIAWGIYPEVTETFVR